MEITKQEKLQLLRKFLDDDTYFKSMCDSLSEKELDEHINSNLGSMIIQAERKGGSL